MRLSSKEAKEKIKKVATELFHKKGYSNVTMKDICEATGYSRGGLYRHYPNIAMIINEVANEVMDSYNIIFNEKVEKGVSAVTILDELMDTYLTNIGETNPSIPLALIEYFSRTSSLENSPFQKGYYESISVLNGILSYGIGTGEFNPVNTKKISNLLIFVIQGTFIMKNVISVEKEVVRGMLDEIRKIIVKADSNHT